MEKTVRMYAAQAQSSVELKKQCVEETGNQSASERWAVEIRSESGAMSSIDLQDLLALVEARQPGLITELLDSEETNPTSEMSPGQAFEKLVEINETVQQHVFRAMRARRTDIDPWETAYDAVFCPQVSTRAFALQDIARIRFEYCDPDTSYEEDVRAFATALNDSIEEHAPKFATEENRPENRRRESRRFGF